VALLLVDQGRVELEHAREAARRGVFHRGVGEEGVALVDEVERAGGVEQWRRRCRWWQAPRPRALRRRGRCRAAAAGDPPRRGRGARARRAAARSASPARRGAGRRAASPGRGSRRPWCRRAARPGSAETWAMRIRRPRAAARRRCRSGAPRSLRRTLRAGGRRSGCVELALDEGAAGLGAAPTQGAVVEQPGERRGERFGVALGHAEAGLAVAHQLGDAGDVAGDAGRAERHRLEKHGRQAVAVAVAPDDAGAGEDARAAHRRDHRVLRAAGRSGSPPRRGRSP
jgi:hypothetical protein